MKVAPETLADWKRKGLLPCGAEGMTRPASPREATARRIRQKRGGPSKLEMEWLKAYGLDFPNYPPVRHQAITLVLANGLRYTPDFFAASWPGNGPAEPTCFEIKGPHAFDGSLDKLKFAAHEWPEIRFYLWWKKDGVWCQQEILK